MKYIDCGKYAQEILDEVKSIPNKGKLVIITVGDDPASKVYVNGKIKDCEYCEIPVEHIKIEDNLFAGDDLLKTILKNNTDDEVVGIILQLPLPEHMRNVDYTKAIVPWKDVDGLNSDLIFKPCTPKGVVHILKKELGDLTGKDVLIIGRSHLVGRPLAKMLTDENCTVTLAHSKTKPEAVLHHMRYADIVVSAVGQAKAFDLCECWSADMVVDVGINRNEHGKLCGDFYGFDVDSYELMKVTPVPKGVGLLTRAMLMQNVAEASERKVKMHEV